MERKLAMRTRAAILAAALTACLGSWIAFFAIPLAPQFGVQPAMFVKMLALVLSSMALGWAGTVMKTGSPRQAWRQMNGYET